MLNDFWTFVETLDDPIEHAFAWEFQESTLAQPIPRPLLELFVAESLKLPARVWKAVFAGILANDLTAEIGKITAPVQLIWGDRDDMATLAEQQMMLDAGPNRQLVRLPYHINDPAFADALVAAFNEIATSRAPVHALGV